LFWIKEARRAARQIVAPDRCAPKRQTKGVTMSTTEHDNESIPWMQQLLDNPFLLLFLGVMIPMLVYTVWGVVDILTIPVAK
jgi:hypothetical protein